MKRIIFALLLLPQLVYAQYRADCFILDSSDDASQMKIGNTYTQDTALTFDVRSKISGLSISGTANLNNDNDSYIRVTLVDNYNYEFLVYENYPALSDDMTSKFSNIALETILLDGITPKSLKIHLLNASLKLDAVNYVNEIANRKQNPDSYESIQKVQVQYIVDKLNANLKKKNMTWRAGVTSMSEKTFSEKKDMFGGTVPELYGFEHYIGGIFVMPGEYLNSPNSRTSNQYVSEWDWRYRHGKNWMTSVKDQGNCGSCWNFAAVGTLEAYVNLYYNQIASYLNSNNEQIIGYNLSEQEIMNCLVNNNCRSHGTPAEAFEYILNNGIINEECFPYVAHDMNCDSDKCDNPAEKVYIDRYDTIPDNASEEYVKNKLFRAPIAFSIFSWLHSMVLVGFKTLEEGDVIRIGERDTVIINESSHQDLIGKTAWLFKNSWGTNWGEENGYAYAIVNTYNRYYTNSIIGSVTCMQHTDNDIICEDADGDGYYFWGVSDEKPSYCPSWIPDIKDGNDACHTKGKLLLENTTIIGELETLNPNDNPAFVIDGNCVILSQQQMFCHVRITSGGKMIVKDILNLFGRVTITIESGGELVVDGGVVTNADITFSPGGKITLKNGGQLVLRTNTNFIVPVGAFADISNGRILRSNDF